MASFLRKFSASLTLFCFFVFSIHPALAFDVTVTSGSASVSQSGDTTTIKTNGKAILQGNTSIAANQIVDIIGPHDLLLRDTSGLQTNWLGTLLSQGNVVLVNTNGIYIAPSANINVQSLIASTLNIQDEAFLTGQLNFQKVNGPDVAKILNEANIKVKDGGYVVFLADQVKNGGTITAYMGSVAFGSGQDITVSFDQGGMINLVVNQGLAKQLTDSSGQDAGQIINQGTINADGGRIQMTASLLKTTLKSIVNNSGVIEANRAVNQDGVIELKADGGIDNTGTIEASKLKEKGYTFNSTGTLNVEKSSFDNLDKAINISGNVAGVISDAANINFTGDVNLTGDTTLQADSGGTNNGEVVMNAHNLAGGNFNLTLDASLSGDSNVDTLDGNITGVNQLTLNSSSGTNETFTSTGASFGITTMKTNFHALFSRTQGTGTSSDPYVIYADSNVRGGLQFINSMNLAAYYVLANNIDATETSSWNSGTGFSPLNGSLGINFNGRNFTISHLFENIPGSAGLFNGLSAATVRNLGLTSVNITGSDFVGGLTTDNGLGTYISNVYVTGSVVASGSYVGGLTGDNNSSIIDNSYVTANVTGGGSNVGGIVGESTTHSTVSNSYATGNISGADKVGGLIGRSNNNSSIINSYATGTASGTGRVGGLVGLNSNTSSIINSFATGVASSTGPAPGGLIGSYGNGTLTNNWWYNAVNVDGVGSGPQAGVTEAGAATDFYNPAHAVYNGATPWDFNFTWYTDGSTYPTFGVNPNTEIWTGSGNWSLAGNWSGGFVPLNTTSVLFNGSDVNDSTIDGGFAGVVANLKIDADYTGTVTQSVNLSIGGDYVQKGGGFASDTTKTFSTGNDFAYTGGTFNRFTGAGTALSPYLIYDVYGLQGMQGYLSSSFGLANNINATATSSWNLGTGFLPIGGVSNPFTGGFNGNNDTIDHLTIDNPAINNVGLFGYTTNAAVKNVGLTNALVTGGQGAIGGLIGYNKSTSVDNSYVTGAVVGSAFSSANVGGLIGTNFSSAVTNSHATDSVQGTDNVGGLIGTQTNSSSIDNSFATGNVTATDSTAGGLVGDNLNSSSVTNSHATGAVTGGGNAGGLIGSSSGGTVSNTYATGNVNGASYLGGLIGTSSSSIDNSYATGNVNGNINIGGLVGFNVTGSIINSYAIGSATGNGNVGGLVGWNLASSQILDAYATGVATSSGDTPGGLIGNDDGSNVLTNNWWYNAVNVNGVGNSAPAGVSEAGAASDFYSSLQAVYNGSNPWDQNFSWLFGGISYPTLGVNPNTDIWTGSGNWSVAGNWSRGIVPDNTVSVLFNGSDTNDATIDGGFAGLVANLKIDTGYTGTISQNTDLTVGGDYIQKNGAFVSDHTKAFSAGSSFAFSGGTFNRFSGAGTGGSPYLIYDVYGLQGMGGYLSSTFGLANNIDATSTSTWSGGTGFAPIGNSSQKFTGTLDGNNDTVSHLAIDLPLTGNVGLFGYLSHATVSRLSLTNVAITGGSTNVGGLAGNSNASSVANSNTSGTVNGGNQVGGLIGYTYLSTLDNSYSSVNVTASGNNAGGLVGQSASSSKVTNSHASGTVAGSNDAGGLIGTNSSSIVDNSYATGNVNGTNNLGGLIGNGTSSSIVSNSYATGTVTGSSYLGGLMGFNQNSSSIDNSYATGSVTGANLLGGLVGNNNASSIDNTYATGNVIGGNQLGGLVGLNTNSSSISHSYATGTTNGSADVGGLVGQNSFTNSISHSFATGVAASSGDIPGGLIGNDDASSALTNNWWFNGVNGAGVGNSAPAGVSQAGAASDFYSSVHAVYNGSNPWDQNYSWIFGGISYPTLGVNPNTDIWTGSGNWSVAGNWSRGIVPDNTISVLFNSGDTNNAAIDGAFAGLVANMKMDVGYTGTITQNANLTVAANFTQDNGAFVSDHTKTFSVGHSFTLNAGTFKRFTGSGTGGSPYLIYDIYGLQGMLGYLTSTFGLANNIDASSTSLWNMGAGFIPIGTGSNSFTGVFNGNSHTISNLFIDRPMSNKPVGLWGEIRQATIQNVGLTNVNVTGLWGVGALAGYVVNQNTIDNVYATGAVTGQGGEVGGLVGSIYSSTLDNSYTTANVTGHNREVGGLVGYGSNTTIDNSYAKGTVAGTDYVGGLVGGGYHYTMDNDYATGTVTATGVYVGGLLGYSGSNTTINTSYATGHVTGASYVGGLVGNIYHSHIDNAYATGNVTGSGSYVGGLVGNSYSNNVLDNTYATGTASGGAMVGGLVGRNRTSASIINSFATGAASSGGDTPGGLIGNDDGSNTLTNNWWYNAVNGVAVGNSAPAGVTQAAAFSDFFNPAHAVYTNAGPWDIAAATGHSWAMSGDNDAYPLLQFRYATTVTDDYQLQLMFLNLAGTYTLANAIDAADTLGWNSGLGFAPVGVSLPFTGTFAGGSHVIDNLYINRPAADNIGLWGQTNHAAIHDLGLTHVQISGHGSVGGLAGSLYANTTVDNAYTSGAVTGTASNTGGLVGNDTSSNISHSFSSSTVSGADKVGGLAGDNSSGNISDSYASGSVSGSGGNIGGLVGYNSSGHIDDSYAAGTVSGSSAVGGLAGYNGSGVLTNVFAIGVASSSGDTPGGLVGNDAGSNTWTNDWWYNATNAVGVGNTSPAGVAKALAASAFYDPTHPVFAIGSVGQWDIFTPVWDTYTNELPRLHYENHAGSLNPLWLGTTSTNFSTASNWSTNAVPGVGSIAIITNQANNPTLSANVTLADLLMGSGTFTQNGNLTLSNDFIQGGGAFVSDTTKTFTVGNSFSFQGGTFNRYTGAGTALSPYLIYDVYGLQGVGGYLGSYLKLNNNIDASTTSLWNNGAGFVPIGNNATPFTGHFDGNAKTVDSLFINRPGTNDVGFFGQTNAAAISRVGLTNVDITGHNNVGGLVGYSMNSSSIDNSYAAGSVSGNSLVGGLAGNNYHSTIDNSYASVLVTATANDIGGLVGYNGYHAAIDNVYATGNVSGTNGVGGLVGQNYFVSSIHHSYASGTATGSSHVGGLLGENILTSSVSNSFATGIAASSGDVPGGLIGNDDGSNTLTNNWWFNAANGAGVGNAAPAGVTQAAAAGDFDKPDQAVYGVGVVGGWDIFTPLWDTYTDALPHLHWENHAGHVYNVWVGTTSTDFATASNWSSGIAPVAASHVFIDHQANDPALSANTTLTDVLMGTGTLMQNADLTVTGNFIQDGGSVVSDHAKTFSANSFTLNGGTFNRYTGVGTAGNPYLIYDVYGLQAMADYLNSDFKLNSNIDATTTSSWNAGAGFMPVGNNITQFTGNLDGNSKIIDGLLINRPGTDDVGLYGVVNGSSLHDLGMTNAHITGQNAVGALAGLLYQNAQMDDVYAAGTVTATADSAGGLVGASLNHSVLANDYAKVDVTGNNFVGGLVGANAASTIQNAYATGSATGTAEVGGLVGGNSASSTVTNAFATGVAVSSGDVPGGLIGNDDASNTLTDNWWFNATNGAGVGNASPAGVSQAGAVSDFYGNGAGTGGAVYVSWDFTAAPVWDTITANYPLLHWEGLGPAPAPGPSPPPARLVSFSIQEEINRQIEYLEGQEHRDKAKIEILIYGYAVKPPDIFVGGEPYSPGAASLPIYWNEDSVVQADQANNIGNLTDLISNFPHLTAPEIKNDLKFPMVGNSDNMVQMNLVP